MATINFPDNPALNEEFTFNGRTWAWTGAKWNTVETSVLTGPAGPAGNGFVNWTYVNTSTALVNQQGAGVDTTNGPLTLNLPTTGLELGDTIAFMDVANTFGYNFCTVNTGGVKINGGDGPLVVNVPGAYINLVYINPTTGWRIF